MRVLLVEPDAPTANSVELMLKSEQMNIYTTDLGEEAVDLAKLYDYDIVLLALNLPDMSGYQALKEIRMAKVKTPVMIVSGLAGIQDKVKGLEYGADDYLTKPFHRDELVARIHSIVRRSKGHAESVIKIGNLAVNLDAKICKVGDQPVHLTGKEFQMLELLALRKGTCVTKEMFLNHIYGGMDEPEIKIIDVFICKLRKKLSQANAGDEEHDGRHFIQTIWGRGYNLSEENIASTPNVRKEHFKAARSNPSYTQAQSESEIQVLRQQVAEMQKLMGLNGAASMEEAMEKLRTYVLQAESKLEDETPVPNQVGESTSLVVSTQFGKASDRTPPPFKNGLRQPIGTIFNLGSLIQIDTSEGLAANLQSGEEVRIEPVVGAIFEVLSHFQGRELNKTNLTAYIFQQESKTNDAKLGMYMSQAQACLTRLVGRNLASSIVQVLSGGGYGMPEMPTMLAGPAQPEKFTQTSSPRTPTILN